MKKKEIEACIEELEHLKGWKVTRDGYAYVSVAQIDSEIKRLERLLAPKEH